MPNETPYKLFYWPMLQGRGEFVRLVLEDAGLAYEDVARKGEDEGGGIKALLALRAGELPGALPYAPPVLEAGGEMIAQTAAICSFLGARHGLAPPDEAGRATALQHLLTVLDAVNEAHDTHHPISVRLYYEDQREEASKRAEAFREERIPAFLGYFERVLERSGGPWLQGEVFTFADLALFQLLCGLEYAFPNTTARLTPTRPRLTRLRAAVAERARVAAYLASERRIPFNEDGIFRRYPELDQHQPACSKRRP